MILFFDTETNGLPKNYNGSPTDLDNWPRVIQLAWQLYDRDGNLQAEACNLIRPDGWTIPVEKFWMDNGYSTEKSELYGFPAGEVLGGFVDAINEAELMIAHNLSFDYPILVAEMIRYGLKANNKPEKFCTMKSTTNLLQLPSPRGRGFKWPKLEELHRYCFGTDFENAHDALADVRATAKCYFHLKTNSILAFT
jgi:DNA polymerase III alpha subunit (gram-positive type)